MKQVFLCYSRADERTAAGLRDELVRQGFRVWWDAFLPVGSNWATEVGRALERSDCMVVLVSPEAMASELVQRELEHAITNLNFKWRVFPVIIKATAEVPGYFGMFKQFDLTRNRARGIKSLVQAIRSPNRRPPFAPIPFVRDATAESGGKTKKKHAMRNGKSRRSLSAEPSRTRSSIA